MLQTVCVTNYGLPERDECREFFVEIPDEDYNNPDRVAELVAEECANAGVEDYGWEYCE